MNSSVELRSEVVRRASRSTGHPWSSEILHGWRLIRLLGEGEWTHVYQARPAEAPQDGPADYAVKTIAPGRSDDPLAVRLLRREAEVAKKVAHPHLISVLSAHLSERPFCLVLPYLGGVPLSIALQAFGAAALPHGLWLGRQIAEALAALHQAGWRHADVKPENICVTPEGHATLIDLGFARRLGSDECRPGQDLYGSLAYAAPESFSASFPCTAASDIYSFGVTLYEMLTGRRPFNEEDASSLAAAQLRQSPPDPREIAPHLPANVSALLKRLLAKEPLRRPDAQELVRLLVELELETFHERLNWRGSNANQPEA